VGAFDSAMRSILRVPGLLEVLEDKALKERIPVLGVCLGMQLFMRGSEEGNLPGLGWVAGDVKRFPIQEGLKIPHMGWNTAHPHGLNALTSHLDPASKYYFVHSYFVKVDNLKNSIMRTKYGFEFDSAICRDNIFGVQFHPEKSHKFGMHILKNFSNL
jgi:glutamine amidotransferase